MNMMMDLLYGRPEKSTYHTTCVRRVKSYLKKFCIQGGEERKFVEGRRTDAWGFDKTKKTIYFCEVKVGPRDLLNAVTEIHVTAFNYKPKNPEYKVIAVIAIPKKLYDELVKYDVGLWRSFRDLCKKTNMAIWIIEQSNIVQIQGPKPKARKKKVRKTPIKSKTTKRKTTVKAKITKARKPSAKTKSITKPKTTRKLKSPATKKSPKTRTKTSKKR